MLLARPTTACRRAALCRSYGIAYWNNKFPHWPLKIRRCGWRRLAQCLLATAAGRDGVALLAGPASSTLPPVQSKRLPHPACSLRGLPCTIPWRLGMSMRICTQHAAQAWHDSMISRPKCCTASPELIVTCPIKSLQLIAAAYCKPPTLSPAAPCQFAPGTPY